MNEETKATLRKLTPILIVGVAIAFAFISGPTAATGLANIHFTETILVLLGWSVISLIDQFKDYVQAKTIEVKQQKIPEQQASE